MKSIIIILISLLVFLTMSINVQAQSCKASNHSQLVDLLLDKIEKFPVSKWRQDGGLISTKYKDVSIVLFGLGLLMVHDDFVDVNKKQGERVTKLHKWLKKTLKSKKQAKILRRLVCPL